MPCLTRDFPENHEIYDCLTLDFPKFVEFWLSIKHPEHQKSLTVFWDVLGVTHSEKLLHVHESTPPSWRLSQIMPN